MGDGLGVDVAGPQGIEALVIGKAGQQGRELPCDGVPLGIVGRVDGRGAYREGLDGLPGGVVEAGAGVAVAEVGVDVGEVFVGEALGSGECGFVVGFGEGEVFGEFVVAVPVGVLLGVLADVEGEVFLVLSGAGGGVGDDEALVAGGQRVLGGAVRAVGGQDTSAAQAPAPRRITIVAESPETIADALTAHLTPDDLKAVTELLLTRI
ncbi:hypothetical protein DRB89_42595 [Streptomyces sp. ICC4]|nr:hypothetical protein DRB89_42595 [Streptomyces sp. ICC4]